MQHPRVPDPVSDEDPNHETNRRANKGADERTDAKAHSRTHEGADAKAADQVPFQESNGYRRRKDNGEQSWHPYIRMWVSVSPEEVADHASPQVSAAEFVKHLGLSNATERATGLIIHRGLVYHPPHHMPLRCTDPQIHLGLPTCHCAAQTHIWS